VFTFFLDRSELGARSTPASGMPANASA